MENSAELAQPLKRPGEGSAYGTSYGEDKALFVADRKYLRLFRPFYSAV